MMAALLLASTALFAFASGLYAIGGIVAADTGRRPLDPFADILRSK